jgi:hypothetical protein
MAADIPAAFLLISFSSIGGTFGPLDYRSHQKRQASVITHNAAFTCAPTKRLG